MRELVATTFVTLDGVMQAPGGPQEDVEGGFKYGGWTVNFWDDTMDQVMSEFMSAPFDLLLGRKTYDIFAAYWPTAADESIGKPFNDATKYVASRGRPSLHWEKSVLIEGDVVEGVAALKQQDGRQIQVHGSGELLQALISHGLVDRHLIWTFPVVLGHGKRLFAEGVEPTSLRLVDSKVSPKGVVMAAYEPSGPVTTGSF